MIPVRDIVPKLLLACPTAKPAWDDHVESWAGQKRGHYNDISVFAHHIVNSFREARTEEFPEFFATLEELLQDGDAEVKDLASIGIIEDIQNIASHEEHGYQVFERWLGPLSHHAWREVEIIWEGKSGLADVLRAEKRDT